MSIELEEFVAVITGGASGMGAATASAFAEAGASVVIADLDEVVGQHTADALRGRGLAVDFIRTDVTDPAAVEAMVDFTVERFGSLDCAVNNAAIAPDSRPVADLDLESFDRIMAVDVRGVALSMKYEIRQMRRQGTGGSIVNIASIRGVRGRENSVAYTAAKHAVVGMSKVAAIENGPHGIRVNAVGPGSIDTPMLHDAIRSAGATPEDYAPKISVFNRFGRPHEVAEATLWLCSPHSSYVTGTLLMVDGGFTA